MAKLDQNGRAVAGVRTCVGTRGRDGSESVDDMRRNQQSYPTRSSAARQDGRGVAARRKSVARSLSSLRRENGGAGGGAGNAGDVLGWGTARKPRIAAALNPA